MQAGLAVFVLYVREKSGGGKETAPALGCGDVRSGQCEYMLVCACQESGAMCKELVCFLGCVSEVCVCFKGGSDDLPCLARGAENRWKALAWGDKVPQLC